MKRGVGVGAGGGAGLGAGGGVGAGSWRAVAATGTDRNSTDDLDDAVCRTPTICAALMPPFCQVLLHSHRALRLPMSFVATDTVLDVTFQSGFCVLKWSVRCWQGFGRCARAGVPASGRMQGRAQH